MRIVSGNVTFWPVITIQQMPLTTDKRRMQILAILPKVLSQSAVAFSSLQELLAAMCKSILAIDFENSDVTTQSHSAFMQLAPVWFSKDFYGRLATVYPCALFTWPPGRALPAVLSAQIEAENSITWKFGWHPIYILDSFRTSKPWGQPLSYMWEGSKVDAFYMKIMLYYWPKFSTYFNGLL